MAETNSKKKKKKFRLPGEFKGTRAEFDKKYGTKFKLPGEFPGTKAEFEKKYGGTTGNLVKKNGNQVKKNGNQGNNTPTPTPAPKKKKKITARSRMRARNEEIHGKSMQPLIDKHSAWKKARKEGTLAEWEKKYHPNRTPQYSKKKKKQNLKVESKKETPNAFNKKLKSKLTDKQVYKPTPNAYNTKFKSKLTDSKVYKKKKKKSFGEKLAASFD